MLFPLNRKKFDELIPLVATGAQYRYCWGKFPDFLRRILVSIAALATILLVRSLFPVEELRGFSFFLGLFALVYWLWSPVLQASLRNYRYRRFKYAGFLRGEVLDIYFSDAVIGTQETVNDRGDLVVVENRERQINLEVGDESGFVTGIQVPLRREHQAIRIGDVAEMLVFSNRPDLSRIEQVSDIFVPDAEVWVSDYPYLRRDEFVAVSRQLKSEPMYEPERNPAEDYDEFDQRLNSSGASSGRLNQRSAEADISKRSTRADVSKRASRRRNAEYDAIDAELLDDSPRGSFLRHQRETERQPDREASSPSGNRPRKRIPKTGAVDPNRTPRRRD